MPQGLQVWDATGAIVIDTSTLVLSMIDSYDVTAGGTTAMPALPAGGETIAAISLIDPYDDAYVSGGSVNYSTGGTVGSRNVKVFLL